MDSKLRRFTWMEKGFAFGIISLLFVLGFYMRFLMDIAYKTCFLTQFESQYFIANPLNILGCSQGH